MFYCYRTSFTSVYVGVIVFYGAQVLGVCVYRAAQSHLLLFCLDVHASFSVVTCLSCRAQYCDKDGVCMLGGGSIMVGQTEFICEPSA